MTLRGSSYESDFQRVRAGLIVLLVGIVILLGALGMAVIRGPQSGADQVALDSSVEPPQRDAGDAQRVGAAAIILGGVLVVVLLVAGYALLRITRQYATASLGKKAEPTPTDDVWAMHQLPEESVDDETTANGEADPIG